MELKIFVMRIFLLLIVVLFSIPLLAQNEADETDSFLPALFSLLLDSENLPIVSISTLSEKIYEGDQGSTSIELEFKLQKALKDEVSFLFASSNGDAESSLDYESVNGAIVFAPGDTQKSVSVSVLGDTSLERDEDFSIVFSNPTGVGFFGGSSTDSLVLTIKDDDARINDSGVLFGGEINSNNENCIGSVIAQQDCSHGRDVSDSGNGNGFAGFDYSKLDLSGAPLPDTASNWRCVKDNVTGLIWEAKTNDGGIQDKDKTYRWGGVTAAGLGTPEQQVRAYQNGWNELVNYVNEISLCGFSDWRVPNPDELSSLLLLGPAVPPVIDTIFFPNTNPDRYWTSHPNISPSTEQTAWYVDFFAGEILFTFTLVGSSFPNNHIRLVR